MILDKSIAKKTAEFLLQIKAIKLQPHNPFTWSSGWSSPIYCDNRITLSHHATRTYIREQLAHLVTNNFGKPDVIAGVATGAIGIGMLVAEELNKPFVYVRANPKVHGRKNSIEGHFKDCAKVVVIEDLISSGKSSLTAVKALKDKGLNIKGLISIFTYSFDEADKNLGKSFINEVKRLRTLPNIQQNTFITSTPLTGPRGLFSAFGDLQLLRLDIPTAPVYQTFRDCNHITFESDSITSG